MDSNGIKFSFRASPRSELRVYFKELRKINEATNKFELVFYVKIDNKQDLKISSLLKLVIENIVNSLTNELAEVKDTLISKQSPFEPILTESSINTNDVKINHQSHTSTLISADQSILKTWSVVAQLNNSNCNINYEFLKIWSKKYTSGIGTSVIYNDIDSSLDISFLTLMGCVLNIKYIKQSQLVF